jgi:hypothetical protein
MDLRNGRSQREEKSRRRVRFESDWATMMRLGRADSGAMDGFAGLGLVVLAIRLDFSRTCFGFIYSGFRSGIFL